MKRGERAQGREREREREIVLVYGSSVRSNTAYEIMADVRATDTARCAREKRQGFPGLNNRRLVQYRYRRLPPVSLPLTPPPTLC